MNFMSVGTKSELRVRGKKKMLLFRKHPSCGFSVLRCMLTVIPMR